MYHGGKGDALKGAPHVRRMLHARGAAAAGPAYQRVSPCGQAGPEAHALVWARWRTVEAVRARVGAGQKQGAVFCGAALRARFAAGEGVHGAQPQGLSVFP